MDRRWMYGRRNTREYLNGVNEFSRQAEEHQRKTGADRIYCPCHDCKNIQMFNDIKIIQEHLIRRGFRQSYHVWLWHGETVVPGATSSLDEIQQVESDESQPDTFESSVSGRVRTHPTKRSGDEDTNVEEERMDETTDGVGDQFEKRNNKRGKGLSKGVQVKETMFLEYDDRGQPAGDWEHEYGKHLGACALKININVKEYRLVPEGDRQAFWDEMKALFHIEDDPEKEKEKLFHSGLARRFRDFKSKLVTRWITKTRKPSKQSAHLMPWEVYKGFITEQDWKEFEADHTNDEAISERARNNAKQNKHHHHSGQKSSKRSKEQWIIDGRYPTDIDEGSSSSRISKRGIEWLLAREVPGEGETWDYANDNIRKVAKRNEDNIEQQTQGTFVPQQNGDALCMTFGKKDQSGRVNGFGGSNVCYQNAFHKPYNNGIGLSQIRLLMEKIKNDVKASLMKDVEQIVDKLVAKHLSSMMQQLGGIKFLEGSNLLQTIRFDPRYVLKGANPEIHMCKQKSKEELDRSSSASVESTARVKWSQQEVDKDISASVGEEGKLLHSLMTSQPEGCGVWTVKLDAKAFHFKKEVETSVTTQDISLFLRGARLSIPVVQVFMMFLIDEFISSFDLSHIGFFCPKTIAASNIRRSYQATIEYMRDIFLSNRDKGEAGYEFILAPYYEEEHWMLIVINLKCGKVFKFDSSMPNKKRPLTIKDCLDVVYSVYKIQGGKGHNSKLKWISIKCAQQTSSTESGYYVLKFMHEIITLYNSCEDLEKEYQERNEPYSDDVINEVRHQWTVFFRNMYM